MQTSTRAGAKLGWGKILGVETLFWLEVESGKSSRDLIDVNHPQSQAYLQSVLQTLHGNNIRMVRLDAVGCAVKKAGSSCFMIPETIAFIEAPAHQAGTLGMEVLVEIHSYFRRQIEIACQVDRIYDFALPPLVLHAIFNRTARYLKQWLEISPRNAITVLDTHDGIGVIDIGADGTDPQEHPGLIPPEKLDALVERIHMNSNGQSRQATGPAASNLDLYQHPAFDGTFSLPETGEYEITLRWHNDDAWAMLEVNFASGSYQISGGP